jgi:endonuclease/exonuclease/phosphatase family metal-dependent hydrolase
VLLTAVLAGCASSGRGDGAVGATATELPQLFESSRPLRVMTFNIRYGTANDGPDHWNHRRDMVVQVFRDHRPDVVGMQEVLRFQLDEIRAALPQYSEISVGRDDGRHGGEASSILYLTGRFDVQEHGTFWLSDTPEVPGSKSWGNNITRICTWARLRDRQAGASFYLFNTHLDHQSQPARERGAELIAQRMNQRSHPDPIILTGDINAGEGNVVVRYLKGEAAGVPSKPGESAPVPPLVDTFRVVHPDASPAGTFNGFTGRRDGEKIDYILTTPEWQVLDAAIVYDNRGGRYPSDHYPVTAVVRLKR